MTTIAKKTDFSKLSRSLEKIESDLIAQNQISKDPLSRVLRYENKNDQEVVALIAAVFAYGNVKQILKTVDRVLSFLGPRPSQTLKDKSGEQWKSFLPRDFRHRFNSADDLGLLFTWLGEVLRRYDGLENAFMISQKPNLNEWLETFIENITSLPSGPYKKPKSKGALFFFPRPSQKSGCKRLLLFLKWMIGKGPHSLGLWKNVDPKILIIPVDTHVLRISQNLGLTKRKQASWLTAQEITDKLKTITPDDPTRYDFALCHLGISQACPSKFKINICNSCDINSLCIRFRSSTN